MPFAKTNAMSGPGMINSAGTASRNGIRVSVMVLPFAPAKA